MDATVPERRMDEGERHAGSDQRDSGEAYSEGAALRRDSHRTTQTMSFLRPVELKLARAEVHAKALADSIQSWTATNQLSARCELREARLGFRLVLQEFADVPPLEEWGLMTGDCVHNFQSALDNLAFALSRLVQDPPSRPREIAFPIFKDEQSFVQNGRRCLAQMRPDAADLIGKLQPFRRDGSPEQGAPEHDALVLLQQLNIDDKHRIPLVTLVAPKTIGHMCQVEFLPRKTPKRTSRLTKPFGRAH